LIFGLAGFPRLELVGAALATVIGRAVTLVLSLSILHFREQMLEFSLPRLRALWDSWKRILYIGIPSAATNILIPLSMAVIVRIVSQFGSPVVAAVGAGTRVEAFVLLVNAALGSALIPFIGQNWGAGKLGRVYAARRLSYRFSFCWGLLCVVALHFAAAPVAGLFTKEHEVMDGIVSYLWIVPLGYGLQGICMLTSASFNAINKPLNAAALGLMRMFALYIPLAYFSAQLYGLSGLFGGIALANIIAGILALLWIRHARKREEPLRSAEANG
jgi:Na+-driven multidrug efflux pump